MTAVATQRFPNYPLTTYLSGRSPIFDMLIKLLGFNGSLERLGAWRDLYITTAGEEPRAILIGSYDVAAQAKILEALRQHPRFVSDRAADTKPFHFVEFHLKSTAGVERAVLAAIDERLAREHEAGNVEWMHRAIRNYDVSDAKAIKRGSKVPDPVTWSLGTLG